MLICPICGEILKTEEKYAVCPKGHNFDRAKEGYFNLLMASGVGGHGDDKAMLRARRDFLERGYYSHLLFALEEKVTELFPEHGVFVDAGCGEGYYTSAIADRLWGEGKKSCVLAFDIAKEAARLAAKKLGARGEVFVGSCYRIPIMRESCDLVLSVFSPFAEEEFFRILKPDGILICAVPMPEHLFSLKKAVYENPLLNEKRAEVGKGFMLCEEKRVKKTISLTDSASIRALFGMTPYAHKTSRADMAKLEKLEELAVETDFNLLIYRKTV